MSGRRCAPTVRRPGRAGSRPTRHHRRAHHRAATGRDRATRPAATDRILRGLKGRASMNTSPTSVVRDTNLSTLPTCFAADRIPRTRAMFELPPSAHQDCNDPAAEQPRPPTAEGAQSRRDGLRPAYLASRGPRPRPPRPGGIRDHRRPHDRATRRYCAQSRPAARRTAPARGYAASTTPVTSQKTARS
jgi:hypothetical protein